MLKVNVLVCVALDNICVEKGYIAGRKFDSPYYKNGSARNSPEELKTILEMVSSRCYLDTSKGEQYRERIFLITCGIKRNYIMNFNNIYVQIYDTET